MIFLNGLKKDFKNKNSWTVSIDEIRTNNLNLDIDNPFVKEKEILDFDTLMQNLDKKNKVILELQNQIKSKLKQILDV